MPGTAIKGPTGIWLVITQRLEDLDFADKSACYHAGSRIDKNNIKSACRAQWPIWLELVPGFGPRSI